MSIKIIPNYIVVISLVFFVSINTASAQVEPNPYPSNEQVLQDYINAARLQNGCGLIPYKLGFDRCNKKSKEQNSACKVASSQGKCTSEDTKAQIKEKKEEFLRCSKARQKVAASFNREMNVLQRQNKKDLKPIAEKIALKIEAEVAGHKKQINQYVDLKNECQRLLTRGEYADAKKK